MRSRPVEPKRASTPADTIRMAEAVAASLEGATDPGSINQRDVALRRAEAVRDKGRALDALFRELIRVLGPRPTASASWSTPRSTYRSSGERVHVGSFRFDDFFDSRSATEELLRRMEEQLRGRTSWRSSRTAGPDAGDAFAQSVHAEQARRQRTWDAGEAFGGDPNRSGPAMDRYRAELAVNFLWNAGVATYRSTDAVDGSPRWVVPDEGTLEYDNEGIAEVANRYGWAGGATFDAAGNPQADNVSTGRFKERVPAELLGRAIVFLAGRGISVSACPDSDYWRISGRDVAARMLQPAAVLDEARARGFAA